jgi:hypothetical protein
MCSLRHTLFRTIAWVALGLAAPPALATWGPINEGEDYDSPNAPASFVFTSAGIYDPTINLVGYLNWQNDASDTIRFSIGPLGSAGYELRQFRASFWTYPSLSSSDQGLHLLLRPAAPSSPPLLSVDLLADSSGQGRITDDSLRLNSGELYTLTISTVGSTSSDTMAAYYLGFSITNPVPEPASRALLLPGALLLAWVAGCRKRRHAFEP